MPDTKESREKQAKRREQRQRRREIREAVERGDEPEPLETVLGVDGGLLDTYLESVEYPTTASELTETGRPRELTDDPDRIALHRLFGELPDGSRESPVDVREALRDVGPIVGKR